MYLINIYVQITHDNGFSINVLVRIMDKIDRKEIVELMHACANAAHAEYHLVELMSINCDETSIIDEFVKQLDCIRNIRVGLMEQLSRQCESVNPLWCVLKHLLLLQFHLFEVYEKSKNVDILKKSQQTMLVIDDLLSVDGLNVLKSCPRCEDDVKKGL